MKDIPALTPAIVAVGTYYDAKVAMPERLVHELVVDGLAANPYSATANYTTCRSQDKGALTFVGGKARRLQSVHWKSSSTPQVRGSIRSMQASDIMLR